MSILLPPPPLAASAHRPQPPSPPLHPILPPAAKYEAEAGRFWDLFYRRNLTRFFKDRHWFAREFPQLLGARTVLEVGGGRRCSAGGRGGQSWYILKPHPSPPPPTHPCTQNRHHCRWAAAWATACTPCWRSTPRHLSTPATLRPPRWAWCWPTPSLPPAGASPRLSPTSRVGGVGGDVFDASVVVGTFVSAVV